MKHGIGMKMHESLATDYEIVDEKVQSSENSFNVQASHARNVYKPICIGCPNDLLSYTFLLSRSVLQHLALAIGKQSQEKYVLMT